MDQNIDIRQGIRDIPGICSGLGIKHAVISPGSRNAPLILAFARYSDINCISIVDERSAAYFALGISQYTREPVALICTSGTAVLNLAPAIAEAYYQDIPLVVFTADRPGEWIDQADGQTIRQHQVFSNYCKGSFELPVETRCGDDLWYTSRTVAEAIALASREPFGPVHINVPLREPLYNPLPDKANRRSFVHSLPAAFTLQDSQKVQLKAQWASFEKKLIVFGMLPPHSELSKLAAVLAGRPDVVVIAENISNIHGANIIDVPETFMAALDEDEKKNFRPDLLLTIGHSIVSKRTRQYLRKFPPRAHWQIDPGARHIDTFKNLSTIVQMAPADFLGMLSDTPVPGISTYREFVTAKLVTIHSNLAKYLEECEFTDLYATGEMIRSIPSGSIVHLANSSSVRYSQIFSSRGDLVYYSNRGTSGIDGCTSTAAGSSYVSGKPVYLITGDLAFIYDSNGLWNSAISKNLKIIVLNNHGGNIFRLIDTSSEISGVRNFFETPQHLDLRKLTEAYGVQYLYCDDAASLSANLQKLNAIEKSAVLEVNTPIELNTQVFKAYYQQLKYLSVS